MEGVYNMYHSITFGDKNTYDDWHLAPSSRPLFDPPKPKTKYLDIPGASGSIDLSESLTSFPLFEDREGDIEFYVLNGYQEWQTLYSEIMDYLHGKKMNAVLEDDLSYHYEGRFSVNKWKSDSYWSKITISYRVNPYKWKNEKTTDEWLWDTFNFETDIIREYKDLQVNGSLDVNVYGNRKTVCPTFISDSDMQVKYNGNTYNITANTETEILEIALTPGDNILTFIGNGTVTINYRGGSL